MRGYGSTSDPRPRYPRSPCPCGYGMCLWCFNTLMESSPARCPNCRAEYDKENITTGQVEPDG
jgi:hypothetical protein